MLQGVSDRLTEIVMEMEMNWDKIMVMRISIKSFPVQVMVDHNNCRMWNISTVWIS